jgi:NAD(P)-dependent dehydrogenase (short-subunit alcohol dehydrogenase family)
LIKKGSVNMNKILVIGATGLLGSHLVKALQGKAEVIEASYRKSPLKVDISDPASLKRLFEMAGPVDGIACLAGMARFVPWDRASDEDWSHGLANKLMGQVNVVRFGAAVVRDGGAITLTSGVLAQHPMQGGAIVTTVNAAVEGFVRAAALETGPRLRINAVSPGWVAETLQVLGMDPTIGLRAAAVAEYYVRQLEDGESGNILVAAKLI